MRYDLPTTVDVNGTEYAIRSDFRDILTMIEALSDAELSAPERTEVLLTIFYPEFEKMQQDEYEAAVEACTRFINCGEKQQGGNPGPKLMDWCQDFPLIIAPINRVLGCEARSLPYLHWWTWIAAYQEIGDCTFAQVVNIRRKKAKGQQLDKSEKEFYSKNRHIIDFQQQYTAEDESKVNEWI